MFTLCMMYGMIRWKSQRYNHAMTFVSMLKSLARFIEYTITLSYMVANRLFSVTVSKIFRIFSELILFHMPGIATK